jgi:NAD(P)-dependent dehydrogenase (short-subunit alcohol dehydrogenase family)
MSICTATSSPRTSRLRVAERAHWLAGRVAVVTGASRGIGSATAMAVASEGAHVVVAARDAAGLDATAAAIREAGGRATATPTDVANAREVDELFGVASGIGPPVALVCAAATLEREPFDEISLASWERTVSVNLTGVFNCCRAAFTMMRKAGEGRIVNIASLSGVYATEKFPGLVAYNASKYGVIGLTEGIAVEGKPFGITAISVSPGAVDTDMLRRANPSLRAGVTADEVAAMIVALLDSPLTVASGANIPLFSNA